MFLVKSKDDFSVWFIPSKQTYSVYKNGKLIVDNKYRYSDVKAYVE